MPSVQIHCIGSVKWLPRDARSAKRGIAIVGRPTVRPSVRIVEVPWALQHSANPLAGGEGVRCRAG